MARAAPSRLVQLRWRTLVENLPPLIWSADPDGKWIWASPQWAAMTGQSVDASLGHGWLDMVHPDDRAAAMMAWIATRRGGKMAVDFRVYDGAEDRFRWHTTLATPVRDRRRDIVVEWIGAATDTDALHAAQHRQQALIEALDDRVRNTLSPMRTIVRQSLAEAGTAEELGSLVLSRIDTLSRVQLHAARGVVQTVDLAAALADEVAALGYPGASDVRLIGDPLMLPLRTGELLALTVHELLVDAVDRRARATQPAGIALSWAVANDAAGSALTLRWEESGVEEGSDAGRRGFSAELLRRTLAYELDASTKVAVRPDRIDIEIVVPLGAAASA